MYLRIREQKNLKVGISLRAELYESYRHPASGRPRCRFICNLGTFQTRFLNNSAKRADFWRKSEISLIANAIDNETKRMVRNKLARRIPPA